MSVCRYCKTYVENKDYLQIHEEKHVLKVLDKFKCFVCNELFASVEKLVQHHDNLHPISLYLNCEFCSRTFASINKLTAHARNHSDYIFFKIKKGVRCSKCLVKFATKALLRAHSKEHLKDSILFRCKYCYRYCSKLNKAKHILICREKFYNEWICGYCRKSFKNEYKQRRHVSVCKKVLKEKN